MRYAVVIEKAGGNYSGFVPDLPGCVATEPTVPAVEEKLREAIRFHIAGLKEGGIRADRVSKIVQLNTAVRSWCVLARTGMAVLAVVAATVLQWLVEVDILDKPFLYTSSLRQWCGIFSDPPPL